MVAVLPFFLMGCGSSDPCAQAEFERSPSGEVLPLQVAHGGGAIDGRDYTNSLEALNQWYDCGCRWFEIDLDWTSDGRLVAIHDWNAAAERIFGAEFNGCWMSRQGFLEQGRLDGLTSLDDETLGRWLSLHSDASVITDCKSANVDALALLTVVIPDQVSRLVPQIYAFDEYEAVRALGFERMILTLYRMEATDQEVIEFVATHEVEAVTLPEDRAFGKLPGRLAGMGVPSFAHTINDNRTFNRLRARGVHGIYTDTLCGCDDG